jgi:hypothetical protein
MLALVFMELGDFAMMRRMLRGIKKRAEAPTVAKYGHSRANLRFRVWRLAVTGRGFGAYGDRRRGHRCSATGIRGGEGLAAPQVHVAAPPPTDLTASRRHICW